MVVEKNMEEMNEKYYIPQIEEFHVGFEFEFFDEDCKDWNSSKIEHQSDLINWTGFFPEAISLRIKYLDREDLESLGFTYYSTNDKSYFGGKAVTYIGFFSTTNYYLHYLSDSRLVIEKELEKGSEYVFQGKIKNKSELKKLLTQLEILK